MNVTIPQKLGATKVLMAPAAVSVQHRGICARLSRCRERTASSLNRRRPHRRCELAANFSCFCDFDGFCFIEPNSNMLYGQVEQALSVSGTSQTTQMRFSNIL